MLASLMLFPLMFAGINNAAAAEDEYTEIEAPGGRVAVFTETPAKKGASMYCEFEIRNVNPDDDWISLIAINLDEGELMDRDSKYLQLDMQYLADEDETIMHAISNSGFEEDSEEPFLYHWQQADWYSLYFTWEDDGVFRYQANVGGGVVGAGVYTETDFDPRFFRVVVSGLKAGINCELE